MIFNLSLPCEKFFRLWPSLVWFQDDGPAPQFGIASDTIWTEFFWTIGLEEEAPLNGHLTKSPDIVVSNPIGQYSSFVGLFKFLKIYSFCDKMLVSEKKRIIEFRHTVNIEYNKWGHISFELFRYLDYWIYLMIFFWRENIFYYEHKKNLENIIR